MAIHFVRARGGVAEATVLATDIRISAVNAALANRIFARAVETDDCDSMTKPGNHVVPIGSSTMCESCGHSWQAKGVPK
jgi:2-methylcitrate dehydratase PrpD